MDRGVSSSLPKLRTYSVDNEVIAWISWFEDANRIHAHLIGLNHKKLEDTKPIIEYCTI